MSTLDISRLELDEQERKAIELIKSKGKEGIYQYELWRKLGLDSRNGSRLVLRLQRKGLITRERVIHNGKRTYKIFLVERKEAEPITVDVDAGLFIEVPCFTCKHINKCHRGGLYDPVDCPILREWIEAKIRERSKLIASRHGHR